jgi:hypothetical protein
VYLSEFSYGFEYDAGSSVAGFAILFYLLYFLVMIGIAVAVYVIKALSLSSIAGRRGIRHPWLAWLPIGEMWILGCISDQYRYVALGQVKNKRKILLVLNILMYAALVGILVLLVNLMVQTIGLTEEMMQDYILTQMLGSAMGMMLLYLVLAGMSIAVTILQYMALYDLYASCEPGNKVLYLALNIFISITLPIFLLVCRKKDLGMPPRKQPVEPVQAIPEPWTNTEE